jgi:glycosyltransferase involved in cell wall biosynthesis
MSKNNSTTRVLHVLSSLEKTSGVASFIINYLRNINRSYIKFDFLVFFEVSDSYNNEIRELGSNIYYIREPKLFSFYNFMADLDTFFKSHKDEWDILHLHEIWCAPVVLSCAKKNGIKVRIMHSHATAYSDKLTSGIRNYLFSKAIPFYATDEFACSIAAGRFLYGRKAVENGKVKIVNNAVDVQRFVFNVQYRLSIRNELMINGHFVVGNVSRFTEQKNHLFLLKIFYEIVRAKPNSVLILVGEGRLKERIEKLASDLGIRDKVYFLGARNDVEKILMAIDILIMPSLYEGLPIVGVESQVSGLPCLFSNNITREVTINENVDFLSLSYKPEIWAQRAFELVGLSKRGDFSIPVEEKGFDIKRQSSILSSCYMEMVKRDLGID